jgi:putative nucleotidyltransferase with HDIG domain
MTDLEVQTTPASADKMPWALDNLPPFPAVATRLVRMLAREDVDITQVGKMIAAEPVFATRVLQMANSPLFAVTRQVKTISHAIVVVGLARVKAMTVTRALGDFVGPALNVKALRVCWRNTLAGAIAAEKLARVCRMDTDFAYVAGLLRDIGRLALLVKYPESYANLLAVTREHAFDIRTVERDLFDIDHCEAGAWLMQRMPFPPELVEVAGHHHDAIVGDSPFGMCQLVRVADRMADALGFAVLPSSGQPTVDEALSELPEGFRRRVQFDPQEMTAEIESRIKSWD